MTILLTQAVRIAGTVTAAGTVVTSLAVEDEMLLVARGVATFPGVNPVQRDGRFDTPLPSPTYAIIGDSLGSRHTIMTAINFAYSSQGPINWAMHKLHWPLQMVRNAAVGGYNCEQIRKTIGSQVLPYRPGYCFIAGGGWNDISQGVATADIVATLKSIFRELLQNGIVPIHIGLHAATSYASDASKLAINTINTECRLWLQHNGGLFVDTYSRTLDTSTGGTLADLTLDGLHFSTLGAQAVGEGPLADALAAFLPALRPVCTSNDYTNIINNPLLLGSNATGTNGFTRTGFGSGSGPNGTNADILNATGSTLTDPAARTDNRAGQTCVMNLTLSAAHGWGRFYQAVRWGATWSSGSYNIGACRIPTVANGFFYQVIAGGTTAGSEPTWPTTVGATVVDSGVTWRAFRIPQAGEWWQAEFEFSGCSITSGTGMPVPIVAMQDNGGSTLGTAYANYFDSTDSNERYPTALAAAYTMRTPPFQILTGTLWMTPQLKAQGANSAQLVIGCNNYSLRRIA